ncbi:MAG: hypothetical protein ABI114_09135, partial [Rhodanobacter sp.]
MSTSAHAWMPELRLASHVQRSVANVSQRIQREESSGRLYCHTCTADLDSGCSPWERLSFDVEHSCTRINLDQRHHAHDDSLGRHRNGPSLFMKFRLCGSTAFTREHDHSVDVSQATAACSVHQLTAAVALASSSGAKWMAGGPTGHCLSFRYSMPIFRSALASLLLAQLLLLTG